MTAGGSGDDVANSSLTCHASLSSSTGHNIKVDTAVPIILTADQEVSPYDSAVPDRDWNRDGTFEISELVLVDRVGREIFRGQASVVVS